ncbi:MAG TPA: hypothetical protein VH852_04540 [Hyphomicrobium sp.]|jgi:hypothetical protein
MIEVVALVCTMQAPLQCKDVNLVFAADSVTPQQCMMYGQMELAKWTAEHPGWRIVQGFKCGRAGRYAKI